MNNLAEGNSYTNILKLMKQQGYNKDVSIAIGRVISSSPLTIDMGKYSIEEEDLTITKTAREAALSANDKALIIVDGNNFYILDKVV